MENGYLLRRHIKRVCSLKLEDDEILHCGVCPFEDLIVDEDPDLIDKFRHKRQMIKEAHDKKRENRG
jgi:hypothetical protein